MFDSDYEARAAWNTRATPKPKRDPLTDPRPGDVVRWDDVTYRVTKREQETVTYVSLDSGAERHMSIETWSDWTGITIEVLHTADEVTP